MSDAELGTAISIHEADRRFFVRAIGLGYWVYWTLSALAVAGFACGAVGGAWAWHEARTSSARVERYVVALDANSAPIGRFALGSSAGNLPDGAYLYFAQQWVRYLRSRPLDEAVGKLQAEETIRSTDGRLFAQLRDSVEAAREKAGSNALEVQEISVNRMQPVEDNTALISVRWREVIRGSSAKPETWSAVLKIVHVPNAVVNEFGLNLLGLYAVAFQPTLVVEG